MIKLAYRKIRNRCFVVTACLLLIVGCSGAAVLCRGQGGHVVVEDVSADCYNNFSVNVFPEVSIASAERGLPSNKGSCAPCVDFPVCVRLAGVFKEFDQAKPTLPDSTTIGSTTIAGFDFSEYRLDSELSVTVNIPLTCLRTIILLI